MNRIKSFIRNLSASKEFCLIVFLFFGLTIISRTAMIVGQMRHSPTWTTPANSKIHVTNNALLGQTIYELLVLAVVLWIGRIRGWSLKSFGLRPTWKWTGVGILLFFAAGFVARFIGMLIDHLAPSLLPSTSPVHMVSELSLPFIILISVVNPVFEESLWGGYFTHALKRHGLWVTVLASASLRTFCHAHLGIRALISILPMGLIYGLVYWRWRQLWPLVVAHSLQMLLSLMGQFYLHPEVPGSQTKYEASWYLIGLAGILLCTIMTWRNRKNQCE